MTLPQVKSRHSYHRFQMNTCKYAEDFEIMKLAEISSSLEPTQPNEIIALQTLG